MSRDRVKRRIVPHEGQMWSVQCSECPRSGETSLRLLNELDRIEMRMWLFHAMLIVSTMWARDVLVFWGARKHKEIIYTACLTSLTFKVALCIFRQKLKRFL